jgi:hypothetical protein
MIDVLRKGENNAKEDNWSAPLRFSYIWKQWVHSLKNVGGLNILATIKSHFPNSIIYDQFIKRNIPGSNIKPAV